MRALQCAALSVALTSGCASTALPTSETPQTQASELGAVSWLSGTWRGARDGALTEERWSEAVGRSMTGAFRVVRDGAGRFYELLVIEKDDDGVNLRMAHFVAGMTSVGEPLLYRLAASAENEATFENIGQDDVRRIAYRRVGDELTVTLTHADGTTETFSFHRQ